MVSIVKEVGYGYGYAGMRKKNKTSSTSTSNSKAGSQPTPKPNQAQTPQNINNGRESGGTVYKTPVSQQPAYLLWNCDFVICDLWLVIVTATFPGELTRLRLTTARI